MLIMAVVLRDLAFTEVCPGPKEFGWEVPFGKPFGLTWVDVIYKNVKIFVDDKEIIYPPSFTDVVTKTSWGACNHCWLLIDTTLQYPKQIVIVGIDEPLEKRSYHYMSGIMKLIYDPTTKEVTVKLACCNLKPWKLKWREAEGAEWKEIDIPPLLPEEKIKEIVEAWCDNPIVQLTPYGFTSTVIGVAALPRSPIATNDWVMKLYNSLDIVEKTPEGKEESIKKYLRVYLFEKHGSWENISIGFDDVSRSHTYTEVLLWAFYNVDTKEAHVLINFANDYECKFKFKNLETDWVPPFKESELLPGKTYIKVKIE